MRRRSLTAIVTAALVAVGALGDARLTAPLEAQRYMHFEPNVPYDGRFTFVRVKYVVRWRSGWEFDYPAMERNFMKLADELTTLHPHVDGSNIHTFDDPALLRYPIAYLSEPGGWYLDDRETEGLRNYLAKGGFLWVDDFMEWSGQGWFPVNVTNDAYKIAVDYIIYGLTH
jgi:hypothetical protein